MSSISGKSQPLPDNASAIPTQKESKKEWRKAVQVKSGAIIKGGGGVISGARVQQTIQAQPQRATQPLAAGHEIAKGPDPETQFRELGKKSKATFEGQTCLTSKQVRAPFDDIPCLQEGAVQVGRRFLHANRVTLNEHIPFIACSAPREGDRQLFWRAIFENVDTIIDVTALGDVEGYYPEVEGKMVVFGKLSITCLEEGPPHRYQILDKETGKEKTVTRMHFSKWPDRGVVDVKQLENLVEAYRQYGGDDKTTLVHCRAGVGRTGTMMVAVAIKDLYDKGELTAENAVKMVENLVLDARKQRGPQCVQVSEQLQLLCNYAKKLTTEGPATEFNVREILTDPRKITTTEQAVQLIQKIADKKADAAEYNLLSAALKIIADDLVNGSLTDPKQMQELGENLQMIRTAVLSSKDSASGYCEPIADDEEESTEDAGYVRGLQPHEKDMVNYTQGLLETKVPKEVREHENFMGRLLYALDSQAIDREHLTVDQLKSRAVHNALVMLRGAYQLEPGKIHFVLTPSTTAVGPDEIEPFALRYVTKEGAVGQVRIVRTGDGSWQILKEKNGSLDYAGLEKQVKFKSLDEIIRTTLGDLSNCVGLTKEVALKQRVIMCGDGQSLEVPDLLLRGLCELPRSLDEELGNDVPLHIINHSAATVRSCLDALFYNVPLKSDMLKEASQFAEFMMCDRLKLQVCAQIVQQDPNYNKKTPPVKDGDYILTPDANHNSRFNVTVKVGSDLVKQTIRINNKGQFKVRGSKVAYPTLERLISDMQHMQKAHQVLLATASPLIKISTSKKSYPSGQFEIECTINGKPVSATLTVAKDGTYSVLGIMGLKTVSEVVETLQSQGVSIERVRNRLLSMPCFEPLFTSELEQTLPNGACMLWQEGDDFRLSYREPEVPNAIKRVGIGVFPDGMRMLELGEAGKTFARGEIKNSVGQLLEAELPGVTTKGYLSLQQNLIYQGEISIAQRDQLLQAPGSCLLRTTSNPARCLFCFNKGGQVVETKVTISPEGKMRVVGRTNWYTPEELMGKYEVKEKTVLIFNGTAKAKLVKVIQDGPAQAVKNNLCREMAQLWLSEYPKMTLSDLLELVSDQKGVRLPSLDDLKKEALDKIDSATIGRLTLEDLEGLLTVPNAKKLLHDKAVEALGALTQENGESYATHQTLNAALKALTVMLRVAEPLTKDEREKLAGALVDALSEQRPPMWLQTDADFVLDKEFKTICTELWQQLDLGEFKMEFKNPNE